MTQGAAQSNQERDLAWVEVRIIADYNTIIVGTAEKQAPQVIVQSWG